VGVVIVCRELHVRGDYLAILWWRRRGTRWDRVPEQHVRLCARRCDHTRVLRRLRRLPQRDITPLPSSKLRHTLHALHNDVHVRQGCSRAGLLDATLDESVAVWSWTGRPHSTAQRRLHLQRQHRAHRRAGASTLGICPDAVALPQNCGGSTG
jgi:hypothetical protein